VALPVAGLVCTVLALACVAGPVLARSHWTTAHPASALLCWAAALTGTVLALSGLLILGLLWSPGVGHALMELAHGCLNAHRHRGVAIAVVAGLAALTVVTVRMTGAVARLRRALGHRRRHQEMLGLVARTDEHNRDVLVLDHPLPVAYCLPARERPIVVSSGALEGLSAEQFAAVLAHERAHLRHRHHLLLLLLDLVVAVLPWPPTARLAGRHVPLLIEMAADDAAVRACGVSAVTGALRRLVTWGRSPPPDRRPVP
jgi:Zn-dependent protease with chaperone function